MTSTAATTTETGQRNRRWVGRTPAGIALVMLMVATACAPAVTTRYFDYHRVRVIDAQENGFFEDGDEMILATISFRTKPGIAGSTQVWFNNGSLDKAATSLEDGDVKTIPNSKGLYVFDDVKAVTLADIQAGERPELIGHIVIGIENDHTPRDLVKDALEDARDQLRTELVNIIEPLDLLELLNDPAALSDELAAAAMRVEDAAVPDLLRKIEIFISSFGNPDDILSSNLLFFVAVDRSLAPFVEPAFANLPPTMYGGAFPFDEPRKIDLTFEDHETEYVVETYIGDGDQGFSPPTTQPPIDDPCFPSTNQPFISEDGIIQCP